MKRKESQFMAERECRAGVARTVGGQRRRTGSNLSDEQKTDKTNTTAHNEHAKIEIDREEMSAVHVTRTSEDSIGPGERAIAVWILQLKN